MKKTSRFKFSGFTLIELLVGLTLVLIVSAVVAPSFMGNLRKGKDKTVQTRAQLLDAAKVSFINAEGKQQAIAKWAVAHAKEGYDASDIASNDPATTVDSKATNSNVPTKASLRDEAKYQLLLPYLENCANLLGYGNQNGEYAPVGYWFHLNGLISDASNITYTPPSSSKTFTLTVNSSDLDKGTATGTGTYKYNQPATATATSKYAYVFKNWTINSGNPSPFDVNASSNNFPVISNTTLTANFDVDESLYHTFNVTAGSGGTATITSASTTPHNGKYIAGTTFTITATADATHVFNNWTSTGGTPASTTSTTTTFTLGNQNASVTANFNVNESLYHTFNVTAGSGGTATITSASTTPHNGKYIVGTTFTITATANTGYLFNNWSSTGGSPANATSTTTTFTLGNQNATATANFASLQMYTITAIANGPGTVSPASVQAHAGDIVTFTATPNNGGSLNENAYLCGIILGHYQRTPNNTPIIFQRRHNYRLGSWSNGSTNTTLQVTVTGDASYTATFTDDFHDTVFKPYGYGTVPAPTTINTPWGNYYGTAADVGKIIFVPW